MAWYGMAAPPVGMRVAHFVWKVAISSTEGSLVWGCACKCESEMRRLIGNEEKERQYWYSTCAPSSSMPI
eukprot:scaffold200562_cov34-Tisochrysis_lutea.AAC.2